MTREGQESYEQPTVLPVDQPDEPDGTFIPNAEAWRQFSDFASPSKTRQPRIFIPHAGLKQGWESWHNGE